MDKVTAARVFIDVAYSQSFTASAERLGMSRPMVTRYIEEMENWLDVRLLNRTTRKVSLTTMGESCLKQVEEWVAASELICNQVKPVGELSGSIRIASSISFAHAQLMPAITAFMQLNPNVNIDVDCNDIHADLIKNRIDLAIRIATSPDPSLIGKAIARCDSVLVATPEYLSTHPVIKVPTDLLQHHCLGYKGSKQHVWNLHQDKVHHAIAVKCQLTANEATALMQAVQSGAGISMLPTYLANTDIKNGKLEKVLKDWRPKPMDIYLLYPSREHLSPIVRAFIDFLSDYFEQLPWAL
ncbi:LysR family transcriptional regulator [Psychromonas marina]|uniref:LysR family transcriptional regulator n=1 Tax=Psychromonas marina TaxID=88364 RepID=A0ABQ6E2G2_9GAMM|nr:LysR family transcriptional regulator [Psychromonas marina]GLS91527.1 LysR family transcriptional regulator [Psychromonas marina]